MVPKNPIEPGTKDIEAAAQHEPVMTREVLDLLQLKPNMNCIDGTLGLGGHARAILETTAPNGRLFGIDRDQAALEIAKTRLEDFDPRVFLQHGSYGQSAQFVESLNWDPVDGMILDLGLSSFQLADEKRGFSFLKDSALDMRMDLEEEMTARELINSLPEKKLEAIFRDLGEERFSKRIAGQVVHSRQRSPIETTHELCEVIFRAVPFLKNKRRIHPATKIFQALRIAVNQELNILQEFLSTPPPFLKTGGVLAIISFHSLEDRVVKRAFRSWEGFEILTKKPLQPSRREVLKNPRARSAKLRAVRRTCWDL